MGQEYRKQHIVSQAYLKRFALERKPGKYQICMGLKGDKEVNLKHCAVKDVGQIQNYYDVRRKADPKYWEHFFDAEFDALCSKPLDRFVSRVALTNPSFYEMAADEKMLLSKIILSQLIRVPQFLDWSTSDYWKTIEASDEAMIQSEPFTRRQKITIRRELKKEQEDRKDIIFSSLFDRTSFNNDCHLLCERIWVVFVNTSKFPFITSDNPALIRSVQYGSEYGAGKNGIASGNTVISFPVTPTILIGIYPPSGFLMDKRFDGRIQYVKDENVVLKYWAEICHNCYQHYFVPNVIG